MLHCVSIVGVCCIFVFVARGVLWFVWRSLVVVRALPAKAVWQAIIWVVFLVLSGVWILLCGCVCSCSCCLVALYLYLVWNCGQVSPGPPVHSGHVSAGGVRLGCVVTYFALLEW